MEQAPDLFVLIRRPHRSIHQPQDDIYSLQRFLRLLIQEFAKLMARAVQAGSIHEDELIRIRGENSQLTFARGLRLG